VGLSRTQHCPHDRTLQEHFYSPHRKQSLCHGSRSVEVMAEKPLPWYTVEGRHGTKHPCAICPRQHKFSTPETLHAHHMGAHPGARCRCPRGELKLIRIKRVEFPQVNVSAVTEDKSIAEMDEPADPLKVTVEDILANEDIWQHDDNPPIDEQHNDNPPIDEPKPKRKQKQQKQP
jgi:hypothetical protein